MARLMDALAGLASPWGYVAVGLLATLESAAFVGLAVPGETALLVGGFLAYRGSASLPWMMAIAAAGAIIGDSIGYEIGRRFGRAIKSSRLGQRVGVERWEKGEAYLVRKGGKAVFLGRFIGVLRALVPSVAGASGMPYRRFLVWNALGGLIWGPSFVFLGYLAGSSYKRVEKIAGRASLVLLLIAVLVAAIVTTARAAARNRDALRARFQRIADVPVIAAVRRRFGAQLNFVAGRFRPGGAFGLSLTAVVAVVAAVGWAFGTVLTGVMAREELVVDEPIRRFFLARQDAEVERFLRAAAALADWRMLLGSTVLLGIWLGRRRLRDTAGLTFCLVGAVALAAVVAPIVGRVGPEGQANSFPSLPAVAVAAWGSGLVVVASRSWRSAVGLVAFVVSLAGVSGVSLLALDRCWFSDELGGLALGALWSGAVLILARLLRLMRRQAVEQGV